MKKFVLAIGLIAVSLTVVACGGAAATPTPVASPTAVASPTTVPTKAPPTATAVPPTPTPVPQTPTPAAPTATATRTRVPTSAATPKPAATATTAKPAAPKGSIAYHKNEGGIDRVNIINVETNGVTPLIDTGQVMDIALGGSGTNAPFGAFSPDNSTRFAYTWTISPGGSNVLRVLNFGLNQTIPVDSSEVSGGNSNPSGISSPTWSPDGTKLAFIKLSANQAWGIFVVNADGTGLTRIRSNPNGEQYRGGLSWSKTGTLVVGYNLANTKNDLYSMYSDGGIIANLTNNPADDGSPAFSPDGKLIAFTSTRDGRSQIYLMNADGSAVRRVSQTEFNEFSPTWSPDGNWIGFASTRNGVTDVYMMDTRGGNVTPISKGGGDHPIWTK